MIGFCVGNEDHDALMDEWAYLCENFGIPLWVRGDTYLKAARKDVMPDLPIVLLLAENSRHVCGNESLVDFEHPEECIYWFGGMNEPVETAPEGTISIVYIPMPEQVIPTSAGAIVAWDRTIKRGESNH